MTLLEESASLMKRRKRVIGVYCNQPIMKPFRVLYGPGHLPS